MRTRTRSSREAAVVLGLCVFSALAPRARADGSRLSVGGEAGAGTMLASYQRNQLRERFDLQGSLRLGVSLAGPLVAQAVARSWWFPSSAGYARATMIGAGLRLEPLVSSRTRLWVDANGGAGFTGDSTRFAFDAGLGLELAATRSWGLGPFARYGQTISTASDFPSDAKYWSAGLAVTLRFPPPPPAPPPPPPPPQPAAPPPDTDGDGILDRDDVCPREPAGPQPDPDPLHRGCPARDTDGDAIVDHLDKCPTIPAGEHPDPERAGCPDGDDDNDGVLNHVDKCPTQPQGLHPDPQRPGCPAADRDGDSVPDVVDACPDKPGAPSPDPKKNGCPGMVRVEIDRITISQPVFFATDKDRILSKSFPVLRAVVDALKATPEIKKLTIDGHADVRGTAEYNLELSRRRATNIKTFFVEHGVAAERLDARGFGNTRPIDDNKTEQGRAKNRRVEFIIVDPPQPPAAGVKP
jgi:outer membrane protein OmpA-like peptidoglycan-associated protein